MKFLLIGAAALALTVVSPVAAKDLTPAKPAGPKDQWSGAYIGAHVGYGQANRNGCGDLGVIVNVLPDINQNLTIPVIDPPDPITSCDTAPPDATFDYNQSGYLFGLQAGYNWMPSEMFLIGLEGSFSTTNMTGDLTDSNSPFQGTATWNSFLTATAKVGVAADKFLVYGEGGVALANAQFDGPLGCSFTMNHVGPVAGAGVSFKINDSASIDLKYNHIWLQPAQASCTSTFDSNFGNIDLFNVNFPTQIWTQGSVDVVKLGLNFKLGGP